MRMALALAGMMVGAVSGHAAEPTQWCSNGFDKPAKLAVDPIDLVKLQNPQGPVDPVTLKAPCVIINAVLTVGERSEPFNVDLGMTETEMTLYPKANETGQGEDLIKAEIFVGHEPGGEVTIVIFRDRVFWPCD